MPSLSPLPSALPPDEPSLLWEETDMLLERLSPTVVANSKRR
jgi:hypothetical protein